MAPILLLFALVAVGATPASTAQDTNTCEPDEQPEGLACVALTEETTGSPDCTTAPKGHGWTMAGADAGAVETWLRGQEHCTESDTASFHHESITWNVTVEDVAHASAHWYTFQDTTETMNHTQDGLVVEATTDAADAYVHTHDDAWATGYTECRVYAHVDGHATGHFWYGATGLEDCPAVLPAPPALDWGALLP